MHIQVPVMPYLKLYASFSAFNIQLPVTDNCVVEVYSGLAACFREDQCSCEVFIGIYMHGRGKISSL